MFGVIYKNTQYHLLKDTLISFGLSLLYPFITCLLPGFLEYLLYQIQKRKENAYIILAKYFNYYKNKSG